MTGPITAAAEMIKASFLVPLRALAQAAEATIAALGEVGALVAVVCLLASVWLLLGYLDEQEAGR